MESLEILQKACNKFGKSGLSKRLKIAESTIYAALANKRGLKPEKTAELINLLGLDSDHKTYSVLVKMIADEADKKTEEQQKEILKFILTMPETK